jgi:magnesium-protoporphyrin O-methyltransferase
MTTATLDRRRGELREYFDRTAVDAWARLTSDAPVGRIRATVRAGRDRMRALLLDRLPLDLSGRRILDAGCGTGAFAIEAARRGAHVVAIDLSPTLVDIARERLPADVAGGQIVFRSGDMLDANLGQFDHVVAMDSLIHYETSDMVRALSELAARTRRSMVVTFAPSSAALEVMHAVGRFFPRGDRAPAIEPVRESRLRREIAAEPRLADWEVSHCERIASGFYTSQALELSHR